MKQDSRLESILKALSYRLLAMSSTTLLVWFFSGTWRLALTIGSIEAVGKLALFYLHERIWANLNRRLTRRSQA